MPSATASRGALARTRAPSELIVHTSIFAPASLTMSTADASTSRLAARSSTKLQSSLAEQPGYRRRNEAFERYGTTPSGRCPVRRVAPTSSTFSVLALCGEGGIHRMVEARSELLRGRALLDQQPLDLRGGALVAGALGHPAQLLVASDLEVLEGIGEGDELAGGVGVRLEERTPVQRSQPHGGVLQQVRRGTALLQQPADGLLVAPALLQVLAHQVREGLVVDHLPAPLQQLDRLHLDGVRIGEVLGELTGEIVPGDVPERPLDRGVEQRLQPAGHGPFAVCDAPRHVDRVDVAGPVGGAHQELV